jgi:hypothetical protein
MTGLQTANAPSHKIVIPHFVVGSLAFLIGMTLLFFTADEWMNLYFSPKLIAIVHVLVLGWGTMIAFGALYQLIPVVYETSLYSEKLAKVTFLVYSLSVVFLSYAFWKASFSQLLFYASLAMFLALMLFITNLSLTYRKRTKSNISSRFITTALLWLTLTVIVGTLTAFNFKYQFFNHSHLQYLKIHAHIGLIGWFVMLIIGASSILIPMFVISHQTNTKKLNLSYVLINMGLIGLSINWFLDSNQIIELVMILSIVLGILNYLRYVYLVFKSRIRKVLDTAMKLTFISLLIMLFTLIIIGILIGFHWFKIPTMSIVLMYGSSIIIGFISTIILGQIYKTLPFIVWLKVYQPYVGKFKTPLPRELYSEKWMKIQMFVYLIGLAIFVNGIVFQQLIIIKIGISLLIITATINLINVIKITFHQQKLTSIN